MDKDECEQEVHQNFALLEKAVVNFDQRLVLKVLRGLPTLRKRIDDATLARIIESAFPVADEAREYLLKYVPKPDTMEVDSEPISGDAPEAAATISPESSIYLHLLVLVRVQSRTDSALPLAKLMVSKLLTFNRRSLDYLAAKVWFYYSRAVELETDSTEGIQAELLAALRTASLRHDTETQASVITLLLRSYLRAQKVSLAANLVSKTTFPESASNALGARYYLYLARINAIQLDYTSAFDRVTIAIRKTPQTPFAVGFLQAAHKLSIVVELLMGDIPDRAVFKEPTLQKSLEPYFAVASAVRVGDLDQFTQAVEKHAAVLRKDENYSLVLRLRQNVIKTGIRIMNLTYSRISLKDICIKLRLDSEESAEFTVAKAIRDGVIDATIDHERGFMQSKELLDVYATAEPQDTLHERIKFCISLHNDSVKSMRYLMNDNRFDLQSAEQAREREKELASELQEDLDEDDGDFDL